jgi:hypothetical protein
MKGNSNFIFLIAFVFTVGYQSVDAQEVKREGPQKN